MRFLRAMGNDGPVMVAGHDIGGGVAQHLLISRVVDVPRLALVNAVMFNSWPVPGVARFRDPAVAAATSTEDVVAARRQSVMKALAGEASEALRSQNISHPGPIPGAVLVGAGWRRR